MPLTNKPHRSQASHFVPTLLLWSSLTVGCVAAIPLIIQIGAVLIQVCLENYGTEKGSLLENLLRAFGIGEEKPKNRVVIRNEASRNSSVSDQTERENTKRIGLDVALLKRTMVNGKPKLIPIHDNDILKDGRGDPQAGDKFQILIRADTDCYLYLAAIDSTAWAQGLFPPMEGAIVNPVRKGQTYTLPAGRNWYSLDQYKGIQHFYFLASHERRPDIEDIFSRMNKLERHPQERPKTVQAPVVLPYSSEHTRTRQVLSRGISQPVEFKTYFSKTAEESLRVTRWFRHQ